MRKDRCIEVISTEDRNNCERGLEDIEGRSNDLRMEKHRNHNQRAQEDIGEDPMYLYGWRKTEATMKELRKTLRMETMCLRMEKDRNNDGGVQEDIGEDPNLQTEKKRDTN